MSTAVARKKVEAGLEFSNPKLRPVDTSKDGKLSEAEILSLLEKEQFVTRLTKIFAALLCMTIICTAVLSFGLVYAVKDTASYNGNLVDAQNKNVLRSKSSLDITPVTIDTSAIADLMVLGIQVDPSSAQRVEVGTIPKDEFMLVINNAVENTVYGIAKVLANGGNGTDLVKYAASRLTQVNGAEEVAIEVDLRNKKLQFGASCTKSSTTCSIFALALNQIDGEGRHLRDRQHAGWDDHTSTYMFQRFTSSIQSKSTTYTKIINFGAPITEVPLPISANTPFDCSNVNVKCGDHPWAVPSCTVRATNEPCYTRKGSPTKQNPQESIGGRGGLCVLQSCDARYKAGTQRRRRRSSAWTNNAPCTPCPASWYYTCPGVEEVVVEERACGNFYGFKTGCQARCKSNYDPFHDSNYDPNT